MWARERRRPKERQVVVGGKRVGGKLAEREGSA